MSIPADKEFALFSCQTTTGYPFIALGQNYDLGGLEFPILVKMQINRGQSSNKSMSCWLHSDLTINCKTEFCHMRNSAADKVNDAVACSNSRVLSRMFSEDEDHRMANIDFENSEIKHLYFKAARQEEIPNALSVYVSKKTYEAYKTSGFRGAWALVTHQGRCIPLRLIPKVDGVDDDHFYGGALIRRFLDPEKADLTGKSMQFSKPFLISNEGKNYESEGVSSSRKKFISLVDLVRKSFREIWRLANDLLERVLKLYFHTPKMGLISDGSFLGDDWGRIVRLHKPAFDMLGISPGDRVEVAWCGVKTYAIALEQKDFNGASNLQSDSNSKMDLRSLHHLFIGISSGVRFDLGMPMKSAVEVRRIIVPLVVQQLNSTLLPVISVIAGGLTIHLNGFSITFLALATMLISLGRLRMTKAPSGRFRSW